MVSWLFKKASPRAFSKFHFLGAPAKKITGPLSTPRNFFWGRLLTFDVEARFSIYYAGRNVMAAAGYLALVGFGPGPGLAAQGSSAYPTGVYSIVGIYSAYPLLKFFLKF